jgi:hypothetical protein
MTGSDKLESIIGAVTKAMVGGGGDIVVDMEKLEDGLTLAGLECTGTTNRGALTAELSFLRDELRIQRTRFEHEDVEEKKAALFDLISKMEAREAEIQARLWPEK